MKLKLCWYIVTNIAWLFSYSFWRAVICDKGFQGKTFAYLILNRALDDILLMIFVPGYPNKAA